MSPVELIAISGSLRAASFNSAIARAACALAPNGASCTVVELIRDLPHYDEDADRQPPPAVVAARAAIAAADGVLFVTPEYNYGLPGGLKNLIDWMSRPFKQHCLMGKPVAVIGSSPSGRGGRASVEYLRQILPALGAVLVGEEIMISAVNEAIDPAVDAPSEELAAHISATVAALADAAGNGRPAGT